MHKSFALQYVYFMPLHFSNARAHHREVKIALYSLWYHHTYRWLSRAQDERVFSQPVHETANYWCDYTRGCIMQFWPPDDEHMCSKHVEAWNKLTVKQIFCASSWLITEISIWNCFPTILCHLEEEIYSGEFSVVEMICYIAFWLFTRGKPNWILNYLFWSSLATKLLL